jgi:uncharacterized protein YjbI with pentapeptide repeats
MRVAALESRVAIRRGGLSCPQCTVVTLSDANLFGATLTYAHLDGAGSQRTDLASAILQHATLTLPTYPASP